MANTNIYYNRAADYNPDEVADGDSVEAEFDSIQLGFKKVEETNAPIASPTFTGIPAVPTAEADTSTTQAASTAFVVGQAATASPVMDGPAAVGTSKKFARQDHVHPTDTSRAPIESPVFTGTPAAPTAAVDTSTTQVATTEFVVGQAATTAPLMDGTAAVGESKKFARQDHVHPADKKAAPSGEVSYFAMSTAPTGWLKCNGAAISRTTYADLFTAIGTTYGTGDGSTTFNLPDLRGEFIRGYDDGRDIDSGRAIGSSQAAYAGALTIDVTTYKVNPGGTAVITDSITVNGTNIGNSGYESRTIEVTANDNRPRNVALLACIKH